MLNGFHISRRPQRLRESTDAGITSRTIRPVQSIHANIAEESSVRYYAEVPEPCMTTEEWVAGNPIRPNGTH
jgi:hypothetical protein